MAAGAADPPPPLGAAASAQHEAGLQRADHEFRAAWMRTAEAADRTQARASALETPRRNITDIMRAEGIQNTEEGRARARALLREGISDRWVDAEHRPRIRRTQRDYDCMLLRFNSYLVRMLHVEEPGIVDPALVPVRWD